MVLNAINKGVPEERLARALHVNIAQIRDEAESLGRDLPGSRHLAPRQAEPPTLSV
jgi:hypothetical protein